MDDDQTGRGKRRWFGFALSQRHDHSDQTDYEPPLGRSVWFGAIFTVALLIVGIVMMIVLFQQAN